MRRTRKFFAVILVICTCFFVIESSQPAVAQVTTATILGVVKDSTDAVLPSVTVTIKNTGNSVTLDPEAKDRWGVPLARVTVYRTENDETMRRYTVRTLTDIHKAAGAVKTFVQPMGTLGVSDPDRGMIASIAGGECRMGKDPKNSVVNSFCQSHEVKNLFVLDASIAVTGGPTENTLTLIALAYRAGEHILQSRRDFLG